MNICIIDPIENVPNYLASVNKYGTPLIKLPLMDNPTILAESDLTSLRDSNALIGQLADAVSMAQTFNTFNQGEVSGAGASLSARLNAPIWKDGATKALEIQLKLGFYSDIQSEKPIGINTGSVASLISKNNFAGHWIHTLNRFISYSILSIDSATGATIAPGVSLKDLKKVKDEIGTKTGSVKVSLLPNTPRMDTTSKLISVLIPGIVWLKMAIVPRISVTYSKHITTLGYPLWAEVDATFVGVTPAFASSFEDGATAGKQMMATSLLGLGIETGVAGLTI